MTLSSLGDTAIVIALGKSLDDATLARVRAVARAIARRRLDGVTDVMAAFASVTVFYEIAKVGGYGRICRALEEIARAAMSEAAALAPARKMEIPVCYGGEFGPDLELVARQARRSCDEIVALHAAGRYRVQAIGFTPGFAYLGGLAPELHTPRRATPRARVPAGAVGIGGAQTGIYPLASPGGWNLIGQTPLRLFDPTRADAALLRTGDEVHFRSITPEEFANSVSRHCGNVIRYKGPQGEVGGRRGAAGPRRDERVEIEVVKPGMLTTVQDMGRRGWRASGVPLAGATDPFAVRLANLLVGNAENAAALEVTLLGPELKFSVAVLVAMAGADFEGLARDVPTRIAAGETLKLGAARNGCRGCLAVAGGIDVAEILGSRSTYLRGGFGGHEGRALHVGDVLGVRRVEREVAEHWRVDERILPAYGNAAVVRVVRGAQADEFESGFFSGELGFRVSHQSDRMGMRLNGPELRRVGDTELRSAPVVPGTVQVPPDGRPIVLLADAQTLGGYPQIAHVVSADLPVLAQLRPGDAVRFNAISLAQAHELALARERALGMLREGLAAKIS